MSSAGTAESSGKSGSAGKNEARSTDPRAAAKTAAVKKHQVHGKDTGSPEVQIALLTQRLEYLNKHFEKHPKDRHSQRGMLLMISQRKGLLSYLKQTSPERYKNLISSLGLRK